jgi:hypothetical protein
MTRFAIAAAALSISGVTAFAHDGAHLHPHGIETGWALMAVIAALVARWHLCLVEALR